MLKAAIFDMDGLLIDSEPFWQKSEIELFQSVSVSLTKEMCMDTMGLRIDEVINHWYARYPWENISHTQLQESIIDRVIDCISAEGNAMPGVYEVLELLKGKGYKLALASSSHLRIIQKVVERLKIAPYFEVLHSAEMEAYGKPHPAIYISTAKLLNVEPVDCMAFEDSFNGLIAGKAARMKTIAVPDPIQYTQTRFDIADIKLPSLADFNEDHLLLLNS